MAGKLEQRLEKNAHFLRLLLGHRASKSLGAEFDEKGGKRRSLWFAHRCGGFSFGVWLVTHKKWRPTTDPKPLQQPLSVGSTVGRSPAFGVGHLCLPTRRHRCAPFRLCCVGNPARRLLHSAHLTVVAPSTTTAAPSSPNSSIIFRPSGAITHSSGSDSSCPRLCLSCLSACTFGFSGSSYVLSLTHFLHKSTIFRALTSSKVCTLSNL